MSHRSNDEEMQQGNDKVEPSSRDELNAGATPNTTSRRAELELRVMTIPVYSWAWSLMPMTTLGLSTLLDGQRSVYNFHVLYTIGVVIYFIGLVQWAILFVAKGARFVLVRGSLTKSFQDPSEAMFFATFWISCYGVLSADVDFAAPSPGSGLATAFLAFFWIYLICALCAGTGLHLLLFHQRHLDARDMTPAWLLPVLPIILIGVLAGSVADTLTPSQAYPVLVAGLLCSSMGFFLSLPMAAIYLHRLFVAGLPRPDIRPGMMIAVGPPTYAPLAYLKMAKSIPKQYGYFDQHRAAFDVVETMLLIISIAIFGMGIFFFLMAFCAILRRAREMSYHLTWYGFVFPNVGLLSTMGLLGVLLPSDGVKWVASVGTACLSGVWVFVTAMHARAILTRSEHLW